jgi:hypothetical protein
VPLAEAVADLLSWSSALDASLRLRLAAYRQGHEDGWRLGYDEGYTAAVLQPGGVPVSNARRVKLKPREPDEVEAAFRDELRRGCPHCGSRQVTGRFRAGVWDYRLSCAPSCPTFSTPRLAHRIAAEAAERAALATGNRLTYRAFGEGSGRVEGAVLALAGGRQP